MRDNSAKYISISACIYCKLKHCKICIMGNKTVSRTLIRMNMVPCLNLNLLGTIFYLINDLIALLGLSIKGIFNDSSNISLWH